MPAVRTCRVSAKDLNGVSHHVDVQASSLFEAAAAALAAFRQYGWAAEALTPNATLRVEVQLPPIVHEVPLKAIERWAASSSASPKEEMAKRAIRHPRP